MVWYDPTTWFDNKLNEETKAFKNKSDQLSTSKQKNQSGEGIDDYTRITGYGVSGISTFNSFHNSYINKQYKNYVQKIANYRRMSSNTEINDVLCDMVNESIQKNDKNNAISLNIIDDSLNKKETVVKTLQNEFKELFFDRLDLNTRIESWMYNYYIDGRIYIENVINKAKHVSGIINTKILPPETMDAIYDQYGQLEAYIQYKKPNTKKPANVDDAMKDNNIIVFWPKQITHLRYDNSKGYLEMCKIPYNQLKLLETSMIIYRIVRAPERFVYKIDTGAMPKEKAMKFVEKVKNKMNKKETFDAETGTLQNNSDVLCIRKNTEIKLLDGRCLPLTDIIDEFNDGKENWVYTINEDNGNIEPGKIIQAKLTRPNEKLIRVHLDDGSYVDTTYDHKFIMRDGSNVRADELKENDSMMPLNKEISYKTSRIEYLDERDDTGCITVEGNHNFTVQLSKNSGIFLKNSIMDNIYLPQSDTRGSDVTSIGGNSGGFTELDDIYYFQKKLYRSLKYPLSRIENKNEGRSSDNLFRGNSMGEIVRDEIKWAKLLEHGQNKFSDMLVNLFLLHLDFKGLKKQYSLTNNSFDISFTKPSDYKEQMDQMILDTRFGNYMQLSNENEFSKSFLQRRYLMWDDDTIQENADSLKKDKELGLTTEDGMGF